MIDFKITTPERIFLEDKVDSLTLPTQMGEITILQNHIPLVANLTHGEIKYRKQGQEFFFAVSGGFIEVKKGNQVVVLADTAEFGHEIDIERAEKAKENAKRMMQEAHKDTESYASAAAMLEKNLARIRVAKKHRTHTHRNLESGTFAE
jgi:F-type H+-transporting ATPase subunit epsilon